ncbi:MAG: GH9, partial [uncultured Chloroflexia bacterium]
MRVNQLGYVPNRKKRAVSVDPSTTPLRWELRDSAGAVVAEGETSVFGDDDASGDHLHGVDFSAFTTPGAGYTLRVGTQVSHPFAVDEAIYRQLRYDALAYFYHNRSGTPIEAAYVGEAHARPAGHVGVAPNRGDTEVPCAPGTDCSYTLDVAGGWYDAGDHGKYVVNGGISVWTLMYLYERTQHLGGSIDRLADGTSNIPEHGNGIPDILDEARWEMEFLLKMQVPDGEPLAGMVHHKIHDDSWTGLPMRPDQDPKQRVLRPPSTAATLNLAAAAAQSARVWEAFDAAFAARCLRAAERTWQAALANPAVYAPASDSEGGGAYNDENVSDEFYWAAAELYATTGDAEYEAFLRQSPHFLAVSTMTWGSTQALGTLTLATAPNNLPKNDQDRARKNIAEAATAFVATLNRQGYRVPFAPAGDGKY